LGTKAYLILPFYVFFLVPLIKKITLRKLTINNDSGDVEERKISFLFSNGFFYFFKWRDRNKY
jgi:hypothetical protein